MDGTAVKGGTKWLVILLSACLVVGCSATVPSSGMSSDAGVKQPSGNVRMSSPTPALATARPRQPSRAERRAAWVEKVRRCIVKRESGGNYRIRSRVTDGHGRYAYGGYQFQDATFHAVTGLRGHASHYSKAVQDRAFRKLFANGKGRHHWYLAGAKRQCW